MPRNIWRVVLLPLFTIGGLCPSSALAVDPTWAKKATAFVGECREKRDYAKCQPIVIPAPDGKASVYVSYQKYVVDDEDTWLRPTLRIERPGRPPIEARMPYGFQDVDLLWSPDSKAFFINGGDGGGYWGFWMRVFRLEDKDFVDVTQQAQRDMVKSFPPCRAIMLDWKTCRGIERNRGYNMSGIDWLSDSSILVMAEVPCSSIYGGIMCQVIGYGIEVPSGKILRRIDSEHLKSDWQPSMAFDFHIPDPPKYK